MTIYGHYAFSNSSNRQAQADHCAGFTESLFSDIGLERLQLLRILFFDNFQLTAAMLYSRTFAAA